jgi:hypothetical protein
MDEIQLRDAQASLLAVVISASAPTKAVPEQAATS